MNSITLQEAQVRLGDTINQMTPGEEVVVTRDKIPVARIVAEPRGKRVPVAGRGKGMLIVVSEDDDHLKDFAECVPSNSWL